MHKLVTRNMKLLIFTKLFKKNVILSHYSMEENHEVTFSQIRRMN